MPRTNRNQLLLIIYHLTLSYSLSHHRQRALLPSILQHSTEQLQYIKKRNRPISQFQKSEEQNSSTQWTYKG
eukprot:scaffold10054_cov140-Cylindrotheca_fusiformis.AAC.5